MAERERKALIKEQKAQTGDGDEAKPSEKKEDHHENDGKVRRTQNDQKKKPTCPFCNF